MEWSRRRLWWLEYNGIEGMILLSELTRRRIRSVSKLIKVGRVEPVMVLRVDKEKAGGPLVPLVHSFEVMGSTRLNSRSFAPRLERRFR